jgi:HD-like signal output (HDOD) protein
MTVASGAVRDDVLRLEQIPPLSATANELLRVAAEPDMDAKRLAAILDKDAALTARIIGLANSVFFGQSRPVLSMEDAIIRVLGQDMVRSLALSMALAGSFDTSRCPAYDLRHYWVTALGTASLARDLAEAVGKPDMIHPDGAYLCGLLHSLGELALMHLRPDLMCDAVHAHLDDPSLDPIELEHVHLGVDRWQAGEWLAFRWQLPEQVQHCIGFFSSGSYAGPHQALVQVVAAARAWVMASLAGDLPDLNPPDAAAAEFQRIVGRFHGRLDALKALAAGLL